MIRPRRPSPQTRAVLLALAATGDEWRYGYELGQEVGLKAGSLYPILIRLTERRLLEARWEDEPPTGRPRRHMYRLTADGVAVAGALLLTVLTIGTMLAFAGQVDLEWANPSPLVPHGPPSIFGPLAGLVIGGATASRRLA